MILADPLCARCRTVLQEDDVRTWAVADGQLTCPNCISPADVASGADVSHWRTLAARLAGGHPMATELVLGILQQHVRDGDRFTVRAWLGHLASEDVHGAAALVELALAAITLMGDE